MRRRNKQRYIKPNPQVLSMLAAKGPAVKTFLMCRPSFYAIQYEINPWMQLRTQANHSKAIEQWNTVHDRILEHGGAIRYIKDEKDQPDMVFTANAGLVCKGRKEIVISNLRHAERKGEEEAFVTWFANEGWKFHYPDKPFEGAGDALPLGDTLICGYGFRSDPSVYQDIGSVWGGLHALVELINPYFYHLDTCFCPLDGGELLIYPGAFTRESLDVIGEVQKRNNTLAFFVPEEEARRFACNAISIGKVVILPAGCPQTMLFLQENGYQPVPVDMSEFIKSGGACKCLTLEIG